jgi:hypothetical protein
MGKELSLCLIRYSPHRNCSQMNVVDLNELYIMYYNNILYEENIDKIRFELHIN